MQLWYFRYKQQSTLTNFLLLTNLINCTRRVLETPLFEEERNSTKDQNFNDMRVMNALIDSPVHERFRSESFIGAAEAVMLVKVS